MVSKLQDRWKPVYLKPLIQDMLNIQGDYILILMKISIQNINSRYYEKKKYSESICECLSKIYMRKKLYSVFFDTTNKILIQKNKF